MLRSLGFRVEVPLNPKPLNPLCVRLFVVARGQPFWQPTLPESELEILVGQNFGTELAFGVQGNVKLKFAMEKGYPARVQGRG